MMKQNRTGKWELTGNVIPMEILEGIAQRQRIVRLDSGECVDIGDYPPATVQAAQRIVKLWNDAYERPTE